VARRLSGVRIEPNRFEPNAAGARDSPDDRDRTPGRGGRAAAGGSTTALEGLTYDEIDAHRSGAGGPVGSTIRRRLTSPEESATTVATRALQLPGGPDRAEESAANGALHARPDRHARRRYAGIRRPRRLAGDRCPEAQARLSGERRALASPTGLSTASVCVCAGHPCPGLIRRRFLRIVNLTVLRYERGRSPRRSQLILATTSPCFDRPASALGARRSGWSAGPVPGATTAICAVGPRVADWAGVGLPRSAQGGPDRVFRAATAYVSSSPQVGRRPPRSCSSTTKLGIPSARIGLWGPFTSPWSWARRRPWVIHDHIPAVRCSSHWRP